MTFYFFVEYFSPLLCKCYVKIDWQVTESPSNLLSFFQKRTIYVGKTNDEIIWFQPISLVCWGEKRALCLGLEVFVLYEPRNNDPSLFISVYSVNHKHIKNEFSVQAQDNWPYMCPSSPASCQKASSKLRQLAPMCLPL